jgi:hypothetical protein
MARRNSKAEGALLLLALAIGLPIYIASKVIESVGWIVPVLIVIGAISLFIWYGRKKKKDRLLYLRNKYNDENIVQKIVGGYFWQGQTQEQLIDSIGRPIAIDNKALKSVVREVWKYNQTGKNRFSLRVTLENGRVTGWDNKA